MTADEAGKPQAPAANGAYYQVQEPEDSYAWSMMLEKMTQVLYAYPRVKGLQIMNDMGQYTFSRYAGKWIPDTPASPASVSPR